MTVAQREFTQIFPQSGWVEHDANEIWATQLGVAADAMASANVLPRNIAAIGITNQRETLVIWDRKTGEPIFHAIVWQDRRTAELCDQMRADRLEPLVQQKTGLVIDAYFSGTKVRWLLDNVPGARVAGRTRRAGFWNSGQLADLEADGWKDPRHRRDERLANDVLQYPRERLGRAAPGGAAGASCDFAHREKFE